MAGTAGVEMFDVDESWVLPQRGEDLGDVTWRGDRSP